jgi:hypothetical protein
MVSVVDAEVHISTRRIAVLLGLTFAGYILIEIAKAQRALDNAHVVEDVELYLKTARLQNLILTDQQEIIDAITNTWSNANYIGPIKRLRFAEWGNQTLGVTLGP